MEDCPKSLRVPAVKEARLQMLAREHIWPLTLFVERLRRDRGFTSKVPYFDPWDGGVRARCLFVHEAPGRKAVESGFISRNNPDETAKNFFCLNEEVGLPRSETITWNIVPWYTGTDEKIRSARTEDIKTGLPYLDELINLLPRLKVVVLVGRKAQRVHDNLRGKWPDLNLFVCPHPSPVNLRCRPENRNKILDELRKIKAFLQNEGEK